MYRAAEGQTPRLLGARKVAVTNLQPITDPKTLARVGPAARGKVVALDLKALGIKHAKCFADVFSDSGGRVDLFFNGRRMLLARFPNEGCMTMKRVLRNAGGITDHNWRDPTITEEVGPNSLGGEFEYREAFYDKHALWLKQLDRGVWFKGYWRVAWQSEAIRVHAIDPEKHTVTFAKPIQGGIGNKYNRPEGNGRESYWLLNLLEEVDRPGEWCVDFVDQYAVRVEGGMRHTVLSNDLYNLGARGVWLADGEEDSTPRTPAGHRVVNNHIHHFAQIQLVYAPGVNCGTGSLYKIGQQAQYPQSIDCRNNVAIQCRYGFTFVTAQPGAAKIGNNVAVQCSRAPYQWSLVEGGKEVRTHQEYASGPNRSYDSNPGFADPAKLDFRLNADAKLLLDLPGFTPIPVEKIGLFLDEYRKALPTADEIDRYGRRAKEAGLHYDIQDWK